MLAGRQFGSRHQPAVAFYHRAGDLEPGFAKPDEVVSDEVPQRVVALGTLHLTTPRIDEDGVGKPMFFRAEIKLEQIKLQSAFLRAHTREEVSRHDPLKHFGIAALQLMSRNFHDAQNPFCAKQATVPTVPAVLTPHS